MTELQPHNIDVSDIESTLVFDTDNRFKPFDEGELIAEGIHEYDNSSIRTMYTQKDDLLVVTRFYRYNGEPLNQREESWSLTDTTVDYNGQQLRPFIEANFYADPVISLTDEFQSFVDLDTLTDE
jgi:hypothetical protein